jgi:hypothetical protein
MTLRAVIQKWLIRTVPVGDSVKKLLRGSLQRNDIA